MKIIDVRIDGERQAMQILVRYGFGGGYAAASRVWGCQSVAVAVEQDISEYHDSWASLPSTADWLFARPRPKVDQLVVDYTVASMAKSLGIDPKTVDRVDADSERLLGKIAAALTKAARAQMAAMIAA